MQIEKIQQFYSIRKDVFKTKKEIANAIFKLNELMHQANCCLNETVDNGFLEDDLIKVAQEYSLHRFNSVIVQDFIEQVDKLLFNELDAKYKDYLSVTSIDIKTTYKSDVCYNNDYDSITYSSVNNKHVLMICSVSIKFYYSKTNKSFIVQIPIKHTIDSDIIEWQNSNDGLYIVKVPLDDNYNLDKIFVSNALLAKICNVFDCSKVKVAVKDYLDGNINTYIVDHCAYKINNNIDTYNDDLNCLLDNKRKAILTCGVFFDSDQCSGNENNNNVLFVAANKFIDDRKDYDPDDV